MSRLPNDLYAVKDAPGTKGAGGKLRAGFTRNKTLLGVLGAVAVVGLALVARRKNAAGTDGASTSTPGTSTITAGSAYQPYDSSSADLYNAIQPQLEQLQQLARQMPAAATSGAGGQPWYASMTDSRRLGIVDLYAQIFQRDPTLAEVNREDATGRSLTQIRGDLLTWAKNNPTLLNNAYNPR